MGLDLKATISLDGSQFERGLTRAGEAVSNAVKSWVVGAVGVYAIEAAIKKTVETAKELVNTSQRLNIGIEKLQVFKEAAKDSGTELESVTTAMEKLGVARAKALGQTGSGIDKAATTAFLQLGIGNSLLSGSGKNDAIMMAIGQKIKDSANPEALIAPLREVFGRAAGSLIPFLETNFDELEKKMKSFGAIMSEDAAIKLKDLADKFTLIEQVMVSNFAPVIIQITLGLLEMLKVVLAFTTVIGGWVVKHAAEWGTGTAFNPRGQSQSINDPVNASHADAIRRAGNANAPTGLQELYGAGQAAGASVNQKMVDFFEKMTLSLDSLIRELQSPAKPLPKGTVNDVLTQTAKISKEKTEGDSLTKVGNFLGSSKGAIGGAQQELVKTSQETAANTREMIDQLNLIYTRLEVPWIRGAGSMHDYGATFPNQ